MVWIAFSPSLFTLPFFFENTVTGESYSYVINHHLVPFLKKKRKLSATTFQHDGAPANFSVQARETLSKQFGDRLIGRGFDVMWPPRSPDLSPLDYWL